MASVQVLTLGYQVGVPELLEEVFLCRRIAEKMSCSADVVPMIVRRYPRSQLIVQPIAKVGPYGWSPPSAKKVDRFGCEQNVHFDFMF